MLDISANIPFRVSQPIDHIPLYDSIGPYFNDRANDVKIHPGVGKYPRIKHAHLFSRREPYALPRKHLLNNDWTGTCYKWCLYYDYGQLEEPISCPSLNRVNEILGKKHHWTTASGSFPFPKPSPVQLAVGWPSGLQRLKEAGSGAAHGLRLSIDMKDLKSTEMLLEADNFLLERTPWHVVLGIHADQALRCNKL